MRDYPSIPNVFRVSGNGTGSTTSINVPESNNSLGHQQNYHRSSAINCNASTNSNSHNNNDNPNNNVKNQCHALSIMPVEHNGNSDNIPIDSFNYNQNHPNHQNHPSHQNRGNSIGLQYLSNDNINRKPSSIVKNAGKNNAVNGPSTSCNFSGNGNTSHVIGNNNSSSNNNNNNYNITNNSNNNTTSNSNNNNSAITQSRPTTMRNMKCMNNNKSSALNGSGTNPYSHSGVVGINTISGGGYMSSSSGNSNVMAMAMTTADGISTRGASTNNNSTSINLDNTETYPRKFLSTRGAVAGNNSVGNANGMDRNGGSCDGGLNSLGSDLNVSINSFDDMSTTTIPFGGRKYTNEKSCGYCLWIMTPVAASFSVAIVIAALAGPQWLYTEEKLPNTNYNGTANFNVKDDGAFITKYTKSSLWIICSALQGMESSYNCIKIDYFPNEGYQPDPHDSTPAIPYTITTACPFFLVSGVFLLISFMVFLVPTCSHQNNLYYFAAGIMFIVSGLFMLIGLITYISILKAEIGSKLRPKSSLQPALFKVSYGQSFFLFVFGFISTEFVGVLNIFLFISLQQVGQYKRLSCLSFINMPEKTGDIENKMRVQRAMTNDEMPRYACKKHPISSSLFFSNDLERRYYFEKPAKCDVHSKNLAKSLNELYTEPAPNFSSFELPQEFPLTRSVSTTTEIYSSHGNTAATSINQLQQNQTMPHSNASGREIKNRKNQTAIVKKDSQSVSYQRSTKDKCSDEANDGRGNNSHIQDICGLSRGIRKTKDELFNEFCKKAGSRPKPKDIYYIEDTGEPEDEESIYIIDGNFIHQHQNQHQLQHAQSQHHQHPSHLNYTPSGAVQQLRRNSMFVEPSSIAMLKRNSNLSLHATEGNGGFIDKSSHLKGHSKLSRCESEIWNNYPDHQYHNKNGILQDCNVYNSRTLPRSFMKRSSDSQEFFGRSTLCGTYPGNRFGHSSRETIYHSGLALHKSCENVNSLNFTTNQSLGQRKMGNASTLLPFPPTLQPLSSKTVQWPATIPTSPSNFSTKSIRYTGNGNGLDICASGVGANSGTSGRVAAGHNNRGNAVSDAGNKLTHHKFQRAYGFDDRKAEAASAFESFDLDEMERERRKSHASLFDGTKATGIGGFYDKINGTAV